MKKALLTVALLVAANVVAEDVVATEDTQVVCNSCSVEAVDLSWLTADEKAKFDALESAEEKTQFLKDAKIARAAKEVIAQNSVVNNDQEISSSKN